MTKALAVLLISMLGVFLAVQVGKQSDRVTAAAATFAAVSAGSYHTCALTGGGAATCWGWNPYGELGDGTTVERHVPTGVSGLTGGSAAVSPGSFHSCALTGGAVTCWGWNMNGQLGDGTAAGPDCSGSCSPTPVAVSGLGSGVSAIAAGVYHSCALTGGGGAKCWGKNGDGELGDGTMAQQTSPVDVSGLTSGVSAIAAGDLHTCALTSIGGTKCWGDNFYGQLGDGGTTDAGAPVDVAGLASGVQTVSAGARHTCVLTTGGGVLCWGDNGQGQLGDGTMTNRPAPTDVSGLTSGVIAISAGGRHTCALTLGGGMKCWGYNAAGQLGDATTTNRTTPVAVSGLGSGVVAVSAGFLHTCAVKSEGGLMCWGWNGFGQLGDNTTVDRTSPVHLAIDTDADGCTDGAEQETATGSELSGGRRDPKNPNDYFNPSGDGVNRIDDILLTVQAYFDDDNDGNPGLPPYAGGYDPDTDRSNMAASPNPWNTGAPDGLQRVQDILHSVNSYFHDCS